MRAPVAAEDADPGQRGVARQAPCVPQGTDGSVSCFQGEKQEEDPSGYLAAAGRAGLRVVPLPMAHPESSEEEPGGAS